MRKITTREWMGGAFAIALAFVWMSYTFAAPGEWFVVELRVTARWSFLLFWLASTGRALEALFGARFDRLARLTRDLGLAFASAQTVHLALVAWMLYVEPNPFPRWPLMFFSVGAFCVYLLALLSIPRVSMRFDPKMLQTVRSIGVEYLAIVFLMDFAKNPFRGGVMNVAAYLPFLALAILGPLLRRAAGLKRLRTSIGDAQDVTEYREAV